MENKLYISLHVIEIILGQGVNNSVHIAIQLSGVKF